MQNLYLQNSLIRQIGADEFFENDRELKKHSKILKLETKSKRSHRQQTIYYIYIYIYIYIYMKTMCPPGYHHNSFVATHALGHIMYSYIYIYIYILYIYIYIYYIYIYYIYI